MRSIAWLPTEQRATSSKVSAGEDPTVVDAILFAAHMDDHAVRKLPERVE